MSAYTAPWLDYANGISLGEYDGEVRVHADDAGNLWLLAWRTDSETDEVRRDPDYDGGLGPTQAEALRKLLNERAAKAERKPGDLFVTLARNPNDSSFGLGETIRFLGDHPENDGDAEFYESLDGSVRGWVSPKYLKPAVSK